MSHISCQIRPIRRSDAPALSVLRRMPGIFENILGKPSFREEQGERYIDSLSDNDHMLVAVTDEPLEEELLLGSCSLRVEHNPRCRHTASLGLMVHVDYQGQGIGSRLLDTILDLADNWLMLVRVELMVFTDNERAVKLYKRHGFEVEGVKRYAAIRNGRYADELYMSRIRNP